MPQLDKFQKLPLAKNILFREAPENRSFHLHCALLGGGHERLRPEADYRFDGRKRGERYFCNMQYSLAGQGGLCFEALGESNYQIKPKQLFFAEVPGANYYYLPKESVRPRIGEKTKMSAGKVAAEKMSQENVGQENVGQENVGQEKAAWEFVYLTLTGSETRRIVAKIVELNGSPVLSLGHKQERELYEILQVLLCEGVDDMLYYSARIYEFLLGLLAQHVQAVRQQELSKLPLKVQRMKQYLQLHFAEVGLSTRDIAEKVGLSETYAMDLFKRHTGQTLHQYLEQLRLTQAQNLLRYSMRSITEVAKMSGFRDSNYFIRVFRKHFGVSPGRSRTGFAAETQSKAQSLNNI